MNKLTTSLKNTATKVSTAITLATASMITGANAVLADGVMDYDIGTGTASGTTGDVVATGKTLQTTGKQIYNVIVALAIIICSIIFVIKAVKFAKSGDNSQERQKAINGLMTAAGAFALIGGVLTIAGWMFGIFGK